MSEPVNESAEVAAVDANQPLLPNTSENALRYPPAQLMNTKSTKSENTPPAESTNATSNPLITKIQDITQEPGDNGSTKTCVTISKGGNVGGRRKSRSKKNGGKKPKKKTTRRKTTRRRKGGKSMKFGGDLSFSELNAAAPTKSVGGTAAVKNITGGNANVSSASVSNMFKGLVGGDAHMTKTMGGNTHVTSASIGGNVPKLMGGNTRVTSASIWGNVPKLMGGNTHMSTPKSMGGKKSKKRKNSRK